MDGARRRALLVISAKKNIIATSLTANAIA
jgi:hypothetical protein